MARHAPPVETPLLVVRTVNRSAVDARNDVKSSPWSEKPGRVSVKVGVSIVIVRARVNVRLIILVSQFQI